MIWRFLSVAVLAALASTVEAADTGWRAKLGSLHFLAVASIYGAVYGRRDLCSVLLPELADELNAAVRHVHETHADIMMEVMNSPDLEDAKASTSDFSEKMLRSDLLEGLRSYCARGAKGLIGDFAAYSGDFRKMLRCSRPGVVCETSP